MYHIQYVSIFNKLSVKDTIRGIQTVNEMKIASTEHYIKCVWHSINDYKIQLQKILNSLL